MMTDNNSYQYLANEMLESLLDLIERQDKSDKYDAEYSNGILTVIDEDDDKEYVINMHSASQKIWYSSPISSTSYFSYKDGEWINGRDEELINLIKSELSL